MLRDCIAQQNDELRRELQSRGLAVSPSDSLASVVPVEEDFRQRIAEKMKKMELRIREDLDRRALFRPKKFLFEPPTAARVPFRGQRNVIKVPSKVRFYNRAVGSENQGGINFGNPRESRVILWTT